MTLAIQIPFWGRMDYLQVAVQSVLEQSDPNWVLTVLDDAYPDPSPGRWVEAIGDDRVRYVRNRATLGVSGNFNRAIELADQEDLVILGNDDVLLRDFVAVMRSLRKQFPDAALMQGGIGIIDSDGASGIPLADRVKARLRPEASEPRLLGGDLLASSLVRGNWLYFPAIVWKRDVLADVRFQEDLGVVQDLQAILSIIFSGGTLALTDDPVFLYRRHAASVSSAAGTDGARFAEERALFRAAGERARVLGWHSTARAATLHFTSRLHAAATIPRALRTRNWRGVRRLAGHALAP